MRPCGVYIMRHRLRKTARLLVRDARLVSLLEVGYGKADPWMEAYEVRPGGVRGATQATRLPLRDLGHPACDRPTVL